jgi:hypothetical protein
VSRLSQYINEHNLKHKSEGYGGEPTHNSLSFGKYQGVPICQINDVDYMEGIIEELNLKEETELHLSNRCAEIHINNIKNTIGKPTNYKDAPF